MWSTNELNLLLSVAVVVKAMGKLIIILTDLSNQVHASAIFNRLTFLETCNLI